MDISTASTLIKATRSRLQDIRTNFDNFAGDWFDAAKDLVEKKNVAIELPRRCGKQTSRSNVPSQSPAEYYMRSVTIPFIGKPKLTYCREKKYIA